MSQYNSSLFSDAIYLFWVNSEGLPGWFEGRSIYAEKLVLAAFAYLYNKKLIDFDLGKRKKFWGEKKTAKVKKLQSTAPDMSGLELVIFTSIRDNSDIYSITQGLIDLWNRLKYNDPWGEVLNIVKNNLLDRGILKQVVKGKVLFITIHKYVVNGDISKETKQMTELNKTLDELQSQGELYEIILSDIKDAIKSLVDEC